jgi:glycine/D-amino acid oxidase-like deaminating enzyme
MKTTPYWWEHAPREDTPEITPPTTVDVAIVGAGFSGLSAAITLARAGLSVVVYEAGQLGEGASSRNGGMVGSSFHKLGIAGLQAQYGFTKTNEIIRESVGFVDFIDDFLKSENIDADFKRSGRFRGALSSDHFTKMASEFESFRESCGVQGSVVQSCDLAAETGSKRFHGGVVYDMDGGLHPAKFHNGLIAKLRAIGVIIIANCPVTSIDRTNAGFTLHTPLGATKAERVALCTNAYTGPQFRYQYRRVLPLRSAMIATDPIAPDLMTRLMPKGRVCGDSRRIVAYYRPSPDGTRILFGGRATGLKDKPLENAHQLHTAMCDIFPDLETTGISHVWSGLVAYTIDHAPHIGQHQGIDFAMGYCGSGVARATYFGQKLAYKILGDEERGRTAFDDLPFQSKPLYTGNPWFMPIVLNWHRIADRLGL